MGQHAQRAHTILLRPGWEPRGDTHSQPRNRIMEAISDTRTAGIDEGRPPRIRREPYIDLCFRLTHKAPVDWCQDFTDHQSKVAFPSKIDIKECLYIETWVR